MFRGLNCTSESLRGNSGAVSDVTISRCLKEASLHDLLTVKVSKSPLTWKMAKVSFRLSFFCLCSSLHYSKLVIILQLNVPMYTTPFGPIVDGVVIPDNPLTTLSHYKTFARYDVMFGLTESEAFHLFPASLGMSLVEWKSRDFSILFSNLTGPHFPSIFPPSCFETAFFCLRARQRRQYHI